MLYRGKLLASSWMELYPPGDFHDQGPIYEQLVHVCCQAFLE